MSSTTYLYTVCNCHDILKLSNCHDILKLSNCHDILKLRNKYIPNYFTTNANLEKMSRMLSLCNVELLQKNINIYKVHQWFIPISLKC